MVLENIAYYDILGKPLMLYLGITTFTLLVITAVLGFLVIKGKVKFAYHKIFAAVTISIATVHGMLGLLAYF